MLNSELQGPKIGKTYPPFFFIYVNGVIRASISPYEGLVSTLSNPVNVFEKNFLGGRFFQFLAPGARNSAFWTSDSDSTQNSTLGTRF